MYSAFGLFSQIINAGITVATTTGDGQVYQKEGPQSQIWMLLGEMLRANDELRHKHNRAIASWRSRRERASERKVTAIAPAWLKLSDDRREFQVIEERAAIVRRIFNDAVNGLVMFATATRLDKEGVPTFGESRWMAPHNDQQDFDQPGSSRRIPATHARRK